MFSSLLITLREGLEDALIIRIILAYLALTLWAYFRPIQAETGQPVNKES